MRCVPLPAVFSAPCPPPSVACRMGGKRHCIAPLSKNCFLAPINNAAPKSSVVTICRGHAAVYQFAATMPHVALRRSRLRDYLRLAACKPVFLIIVFPLGCPRSKNRAPFSSSLRKLPSRPKNLLGSVPPPSSGCASASSLLVLTPI